MQARNGTAAEPLYVVCRSGGRGKQACEKFLAAGISNVVYNVEGGTLACVDAGLPGRPRQEGDLAGAAGSDRRRFADLAGSVTLGWTVNAGIFWIIGASSAAAGLVFAGITDTCGMGMLLARMPWNQCSQSDECQLRVGPS